MATKVGHRNPSPGRLTKDSGWSIVYKEHDNPCFPEGFYVQRNRYYKANDGRESLLGSCIGPFAKKSECQKWIDTEGAKQ